MLKIANFSPMRIICLCLFVVGLLAACSGPESEVTDEVISAAIPRLLFEDEGQIVYKNKVPSTWTYIDTSGKTIFNTLPGVIKYRGGFTMRFPKRSYSITLTENQSIAGLQANDDFMLISNHNDKSFLRHKFAYDLFMAFSPDNIAPKTGFIELTRNGTYEGIYVATQKMGKTRLEMNLSDTNACIYKDPPVFRDPKFPDIDNQQPADNWFHQKYPKTVARNKNYELYHLRDFIHTSSDKAFVDSASGISSYFDLENIMYWHMLLLVTNNGDGIFKNFYLYRPNGETKFRICPWDYDHSLGRDGDGQTNLEGKAKILDNALLRRLLETNAGNYRDRFTEFYDFAISVGLLSNSYFNDYIDAQSAVIEPCLQRNAARWPLDDEIYFDSTTNEEDWQLMKDWWAAHLIFVDTYMKSL
jgi:hypothetical protein